MTLVPPTKPPTAIELFAGVGGFRLGLEASGWSIVWSNQWEPATKIQHASSCYVANFGANSHSNEDIEIAIDKHLAGHDMIPQADMIVGGFPCQDYSVAKSLSASEGLKGKKGVLWWQIHRLVKSHRPKLVFLENVDRLLKSPSSQRGRDFAVMLRTLGDLGYQIEWRVVNSSEYGSPQRRIRVFILGIREDLASRSTNQLQSEVVGKVFSGAFPIIEFSKLNSFELEVDPSEVSRNFNLAGRTSPFQNAGSYVKGVVTTATAISSISAEIRKLGDILLHDDEVPKDYWIDPIKLPEWEFLKGAKRLQRTSPSGHTYHYSEGKMAFPDSLERPSRTILTGEGGSSPSRFKHVVRTGGGYRRLTPVELERLNGFPDDWTKYDSVGKPISDSRRAFFMGNALVVSMIQAVGEELNRRFFTGANQP